MPFCHASVLQEITDDIKIKQELKSGTQGAAMCQKMKCSNYILMSSVIYYCADPSATWILLVLYIKKQNVVNSDIIYGPLFQ